MKKNLILSFVLLSISILSLAQTGSDPAAKLILDKVSAKFKTYKAVLSGFNLKVEDGKGKLQGDKTGTVSMKGSKYMVKISGQEIYCDGKNVWTYDKSANEVTITKVDPSATTLTPQKLFTNFYDKDFLYKLNGEKKDGAKTIQEIEMTPTDKGKTFHKVYVFVDKAAQSIYRASILEKNGNKYTYTVNSIKEVPTVSDDMFVFDKKKFPGVEEVDLR